MAVRADCGSRASENAWLGSGVGSGQIPESGDVGVISGSIFTVGDEPVAIRADHRSEDVKGITVKGARVGSGVLSGQIPQPSSVFRIVTINDQPMAVGADCHISAKAM